jgi:uncharacterized integral membrane protein
MNDDSQNNSTSSQPNQPEPLSRSEARQQRREERRAMRGSTGAWVGGAVLILLGVVFLAQNMGYTILTGNWWALFILIPAVGALGNAWRLYQSAGNRLNGAARGSLFGGLILLIITAIFLFNLNWAILGPLVIILVGLGILLNAVLG